MNTRAAGYASGGGCRRSGIAFLLASVLMTALVQAEELAYVRSESAADSSTGRAHGNAWLFSRGKACFAALPKHVLIDATTGRDDRYARVVVVRPGRVPIEAQGDRCGVFPDRDLALLRVTGVSDLTDCGRPLSGIASIDRLLGQAAQASLETATDSGRLERSTLEIRAATKDPDHFWVASIANRDRLLEGMSGGLVRINDELAGFLVTVSADADGPARVLRADQAAVRIVRELESPAASVDQGRTCATPAATLQQAPTGRRSSLPVAGQNLASASCGASIVTWSAPALAPAQRPENLLGSGGANGRWRASASGEITVDVRLCPTAKAAVQKLEMDTTGCEPGDDEAFDFEASVRGEASGSSVTLGYGSLKAAGLTTVSSGEAVIGRMIRLRFVPRTKGAHTLCLGSLSLQ